MAERDGEQQPPRYSVIPARGIGPRGGRRGWEIQDRWAPLRRSGIRFPTKREAQGVADDLNAEGYSGSSRADGT